MSVTIKYTGLKEFKNYIDRYARELPNMTEQFLQNLAREGIPVVDTNMMIAMGDSSPTHTSWVEVVNNGSTIKATLWVEGDDLAFIEFGAGIYYNNEDHPKASEFGVGIGTYGKGQGLNYGWFYYDDMGNKKFSRGTEMTMPVFKASQEMERKFFEVAMQTFGEK